VCGTTPEGEQGWVPLVNVEIMKSDFSSQALDANDEPLFGLAQ
jgi:hypothetical protein